MARRPVIDTISIRKKIGWIVMSFAVSRRSLSSTKGFHMSNLSIEKDERTVTFHIDGKLENDVVGDLETSWEFVRLNDLKLVRIDLCNLNEVDEHGKALLLRMLSSGVQFVIPPHPPHLALGDEHAGN